MLVPFSFAVNATNFAKTALPLVVEKLLDMGEAGRYDFAFIDADKPGYDAYYELCLQLIRPGGIIAIDNVRSFHTDVTAAD